LFSCGVEVIIATDLLQGEILLVVNVMVFNGEDLAPQGR